tara:strand:- start:524 stop:688 length:165 start_codon:yes stop_codon:yes gene_type:complete
MEDYNINFQEILDNMTLQDLKRFNERLKEEFDKRLVAAQTRLEEDKKVLDYLSK